MGSALAKESVNGSSPQQKKTGLGDLPESCVASVLMNLDPKDICNFAKLNKAFHGASSADFVWESKLPSNYQQIIQKMVDEDDKNINNPVYSCKKDIYASLSRFNSIDDGTKKVWLDKTTGGICMAISAKGLSITGIDDRRYWNHIPTDESRFSTVAYLQQIWWFEINGEVDFPFPEGTYSVFFRVQLGRTMKKFGRRLCNTEQIHGWNMKPVHFQLSTSEGQRTVSQCFLEGPGQWLHYHVGDFVVKNSEGPTQLKFSMMQIDCTHTKGGLCVDSVVIYPSCFKERLKRF
ncbi:F-box protein PP2-A12 isoform X1 [Beta vulgaris subsp. vulgaris]|uniref:F-box protein PP2-A12 isoform X1 n=1 Tax=Beta vulgaris subsp. vulgaris TaxID=3555 RepID=UPI0020374D73|nr:F-box protein PP2-A12 isoform X1 [Beta vulgaris subsp. vulgaris]